MHTDGDQTAATEQNDRMDGAFEPRLEDYRLLTGAGNFQDDEATAGAAWGVFVRSPHAFADIRGIDTASAQAAPGVLAVLTAVERRTEASARAVERASSDPTAMKPMNKAGRPAAEWAEPGPGTKGNADQQSMHRTQSRARVTQALDRVRKAAKQRKKEQFTSLLHHMNVDLLL